jgi:hypothetical protein
MCKCYYFGRKDGATAESAHGADRTRAVDFGTNPYVRAYADFGAATVRSSGSGPRRRTVLTAPDFAGRRPEVLEFAGANPTEPSCPSTAVSAPRLERDNVVHAMSPS